MPAVSTREIIDTEVFMENNRGIIEKLTSRKLWVTIIGVIIGIAMAFGVEGSEYTEILAHYYPGTTLVTS